MQRKAVTKIVRAKMKNQIQHSEALDVVRSPRWLKILLWGLNLLVPATFLGAFYYDLTTEPIISELGVTSSVFVFNLLKVLKNHSAELISGVQTLILLETMLVVWWYALETQRMRKASIAQAKSFEEQIRISQETLDLARDERKRLLTPKFDFVSGPIFENGGILQARMKVGGAFVSNIEITADGKHDCKFGLSQDTKKGDYEVYIHQVVTKDEKIGITVAYRDQDGIFWEQKFIWIYEDGRGRILPVGLPNSVPEDKILTAQS